MGKLATVTHDGSEITLSMIKWGALRRMMLSRTRGGIGQPALFVPQYEIAIYDGSQKVVFSKKPTYVFYYPDEETALEKWDELVAIIKLGGLDRFAIWRFVHEGHPAKQGFLGKLPSDLEVLLAAGGES